MTSSIITSTLDAAKAARAAIDAALGLPAISTNAATGQPSIPGWTVTACTIVEAADWPTPGTTSYVLPLRPEDVAAAQAAGLSVVDVDLSSIDRATVYGINETTKIAKTRTLDDAKAAALATIRRRTIEARERGFLHSDGKRYTLDHDACRQIMEAKSWALYDDAHGTSNMRYPLIWPSVDRCGFVSMANTADVVAFALAYSLADRALTEQMAGLEMSVALAETVGDVHAVIGAAP